MQKRFFKLKLIVVLVLLATIPLGIAQQEKDAAANKGISVDDEGNLTLDLREIEIRSFINLMAKLNDLIAILGDEVKGKVTIYSPEKLDTDGAFEMLMAVLDAKGFTIIRTDKFLKIVRKNEAVQKPIDVRFGADPYDVPFEDRVITQVIPVEYSDANEILNNIRPLISSTGNAFVNKETNSLILTDIATNIHRLLILVDHLDKEQPAVQKAQTVVYAIRYMKAKEIGDAIEKVFGQKSGKTDAKSEAADFKITPVEAVNALIITAEKELHPEIEKTLDKLDIRRRQVLIKVKIVEATFTDGMNFSTFLERFASQKGDTTHSINFSSDLTNPFITYKLTTQDLDAVFTALQQDDQFTILSSPRLVTMDNEKAKINVGQEQPILKSTTDVGTGADTSTVSDFIFKDVGIELEITPQINVDRDVTLEVFFKITRILRFEDVGDQQQPVIGKREASSHVAVLDGNTLVIGGLIENNTRDLRSQVPILGAIPIIGALFSKTQSQQDQTELLVFITPHVIANAQEGNELTKRELEQAPAVSSETKLEVKKQNE